MYLSKWKKFKEYCEQKGAEPKRATPSLVANFLNYLDVVEHLAPATIKAYRAAIGHMTRASTGYDPGEDMVCSQLLKSIERASPPARSKVPSWDVSIVLRALLASDNTDDQLTHHLFTAKVTFLLALATGERRSGVHALSHEARVDMAIPPNLILKFVEGFIPKAWFLRKNRATLGNIEIPCVNDAATEQICPVHTTIRYLELVNARRSPAQTSLLVPHSPTNIKNLAIQAVPRYIVRLVKWAYSYFNLEAPDNVRGHDMRGVAASLAALSGVSLPDVLLSGDWTNAGTFLKHYFQGFSPDCVRDLRRIPSVVAGKKLIVPSSLQTAE